MKANIYIDNPNEYLHQSVNVEIEIVAVPSSGDCFYMTGEMQNELSDKMLAYYQRHKNDKFFEEIYGEPQEWKGKTYFQLEDYIWVESIAWCRNDNGIYEPHITLCNDHSKCMINKNNNK